MTGPGIFSYSTTPANNVNSNTGINWDEGMSPAAVNNSARQNMTDTRNAFNDLIWFKYGKGDLDYSPVYVSGTSYKIAGADVSAIYHAGRRTKAVGSGTGTINGTIASVAFSTDTTVTVVWDSGSLSNETLTIYISQEQVTGKPISPRCVKWSGSNDAATAGDIGEVVSGSRASASGLSLTTGTPAEIANLSLTAGDWEIDGIVYYSGNVLTTVQYAFAGISATTATMPGNIDTTRNSLFFNNDTVFATMDIAVPLAPSRISIASPATYYLNAQLSFGVSTANGYGYIRARRAR